MTTPRIPRAEPGHEARLRPSDERARLASSDRVTRRIAIVALALAIVGTGFAAWRFFAPADPGCQAAAWDTTPVVDELPLGWTIGASQFDLNRRQMTILGPAPQDETTNQAVLYATITCFPQGAAESVTRSSEAATAAGQTVSARKDLGDQGYLAIDASGASFLQFRHGGVVVYLAASRDALGAEVDAVASAFDRALGGDGAAAVTGTPANGGASPSGDIPSAVASSDVPAESPAAPDLESLLPAQVGATTMTIDSALGSTLLSNDRIVTAALRAAGLQQDDLRIAEAYDASAPDGLWIRAISVKGMTGDKLQKFVLESLLIATGPGVKTDKVTLAGKSYTRVDLGDGGPLAYVITRADHAIVIDTTDAALAAQAAAALP